MASRKKTTLIGAGAMGGALLSGWITSGLLKPRSVTVVDVDPTKAASLARRYKVEASTDAVCAVSRSSCVVLAIKPQQMRGCLVQVGPRMNRGALVVSIAAGVSTAQIERDLPRANPVVRVMPNTPALLGCGMSGLCRGKRATTFHLKRVLRLFNAVGKTVVVPEKLMDTVTALSGSGPAYFFRMVEALSKAGVEGGLSRDQALLMASQTAFGAARMLLETGRDPEALRIQVTSPGGTTQAGLAVLEKAGFADSLEKCVKAAAARGAELRRMND